MSKTINIHAYNSVSNIEPFFAINSLIAEFDQILKHACFIKFDGTPFEIEN